MTAYRVWAPAATTVELNIDGEVVPLESSGGYWSTDREQRDGERYGYSIDGGAVLPDPRSRRQPDGVHGMSAVYDSGSFAWTDSGWTGRQLAGGTIYELHIGTFTPQGTLDSAGGWGDTTVIVPGRPLIDVLTGRSYPGGNLLLADLFEKYPVALLAPVEEDR